MLTAVAAAMTAFQSYGIGKHTEERTLSMDEEVAIARSIFEKKEDVLALRIYGLICESCAHGLQIKFKKLDFVDRKRFKNGVELDIYNQYMTVALKDGENVDLKKVFGSIDDAGYEAKTLFVLDSVANVDDEKKSFWLEKSGEAVFVLADEKDLEALEHGHAHEVLVVSSLDGKPDSNGLGSRVIDTIHER